MIRQILNNIEYNINFKNIFNKDNCHVFFYLIGCTSVFLSCELLKSSSLITKNNNYYNNCLKILSKDLYEKDLNKVCNFLEHHENFQLFTYNIFYTWSLVYVLINEIIHKNNLKITYWLLVHLSAIIFYLIGEIKLFQFSIDSNTNYNTPHIIILSSVGIILTLLIIHQIYYNRIKYKIIIYFMFIYLVIYLLFLSISNNIIFHFHHSLVSGLLTFFFTNFDKNLDLYFHAIFMGIVIQGFNSYSLQEIMMFYIPDISQPSFIYLLILFCSFFTIFIMLLLCRNKYFYENTDVERSLELYQLL